MAAAGELGRIKVVLRIEVLIPQLHHSGITGNHRLLDLDTTLWAASASANTITNAGLPLMTMLALPVSPMATVTGVVMR